MHRKSPMSNSHPPLISEGIYRVQGCREEVISLNSKPHSSDSAGVQLPPTHKATKHKRRYLMYSFLILSCQPAWYSIITKNLNMLSWLPVGLSVRDMMCDLWLKWMEQELMLLQAQWHGQISAPCSHITHNAMPADSAKPCRGHMNYVPSQMSVGIQMLYTQLMITVMWHQLYIWREIWNGLDLPLRQCI